MLLSWQWLSLWRSMLLSFFQIPLTCGYSVYSFIGHSLFWVIVTAIFTLVNYNRMLNSRLEEMIKTTDEQEDILITLHDQNLRGTDLTLPINNLLYIKRLRKTMSQHHMLSKEVDTKNRTSFYVDSLEWHSPYDNIFRCHRSFLVNINNISSAKPIPTVISCAFSGCDDFIQSRTFVRSSPLRWLISIH